MNLWPHQHRGIDSVIDAITHGQNRVLLTSPTGMGKSVMMCRIIEHYVSQGWYAVLYSNRRMLIEQLCRTMDKAGIDHGVRAAGYSDDNKHWPVQISSLPTERKRVLEQERWQIHGIGRKCLAVVDECFPAGTLVDGKPIENIEVGDVVSCVNHADGTLHKRRVVATSKKSTKYICQLTFQSGRRLVCTPNHPIWSVTQKKYVPAMFLNFNEEVFNHGEKLSQESSRTNLFNVRQFVYDNKANAGIGTSVLQQNMQSCLLENQKLRQAGNTQEALRSHESQEPNVKPGCVGENEKHNCGEWLQAGEARRERSWADALRENDCRCFGVGNQCDCEYTRGPQTWLSNPLQNRRWERGIEGCHRSGRPIPQRYQEEVARQKETGLAGIERVDRVEVYEQGDWHKFVDLCPAGVVYNFEVEEFNNYFANGFLVHNCHLNNGATARRLYDMHIENGHVLLGVTATPLELADTYNLLIQAGTVSEGRQCGALVPSRHYGCTEPDLKHIKKVVVGQDLTEKQNRKAIMVPGIFGRVFEWYEKLNPEQLPTILFGPGVAESLWFAERFYEAGISAAHIDGEDVWINGHVYKSDSEARQAITDGSKSGDIKVVCNRFVLREGIDWPHLRHGIFATVVGSLQSYLQMGGRLLRGSPGKESCIIQDHGGAWHRHGSLNQDRYWQLNQTPTMIAAMREERFRSKEDKEPFRCPKCAQILMTPNCPCGFVVDTTRKSRPVIQENGQLKEYIGDIYKPRRVAKDLTLQEKWKQMYHRSRKGRGRKTFRQAEALFAQENNWQWPDRSWPMMPKNPEDFFRYVDEVPRERLNQ